MSWHVGRIEAHRVERDQRVDPVDRLGDAGRLEQIELAHALDEADDLAIEPVARAGSTDADDLELALDRRVVDPVVEAAPLQRVVDLARAVAGDDDDRRRCRADRAELGDRQLVLGQHLEQEGVEGLVGAVELVDEQDRRLLLRQRLQQRSFDQHVARVEALREPLAARAIAHLVRCFGQADRHHLARHVPLVGGLRDVEALVALHAQQGRAERARQRFRQLGLADARLAFEEQRALERKAEKDGGGEAAVGDVVLAGEEADDGIDVGGRRSCARHALMVARAEP